MASYTVKQTVVENLNADLDGKQPAGDYPTNASLTESLQSNLLNYTTNRILEIPQDIKLELNNGNVTLKAGSKVYVPNGFESDGTTPKFDVVTVQNDTSTNWKYNSKYVVYFDFVNNIVKLREPSVVYSGSTQPSGNQDIVWYDTGNNLVKTTHDYGSTWENNASFPVAIATDTASNGFTSTDQVFNGFGYIGSTVFALPGVKVQIPNGRNEDGTCKNIEHTNSSVITTQEAGNKNSVNLVLTTTAIGGNIVYDYDEKTNYCFRNDTGAIYTDRIIIGKISVSSGKITSFEPYTVDSVANSNASNFSQAGRSYLSGLGMPSNKYIKLKSGASDSAYAAPANGYFCAKVQWKDPASFLSMNNGNVVGYCQTGTGGATVGFTFVPVKKGDVVNISYHEIIVYWFGFTYAEGE